ncbi:carboxypeptidase-like regulatory domain-containing protein [Marinifilum sp. D737]|uniref:carboxypeptidase-like regulatory domain-containing protein n=1 Tax=Marinifilum sp. D737 TaxID=2969628 RepID=UPI0022761779|nr:carboxypeptidase-like regulatory domain-containing protein [Marinifilum sp. D737]MCY1635261.1 carboxypeptidase-like regulatory domain-containing protein [Marinifilum sp. D737]
MIARYLSKLQSYQHIEDVLEDNQSVFETDQSTKGQITVFKGYHAKLRHLQIEHNQSTKAVTSEKNNLYKDLSMKSKLIIIALIRFANDTDNETLRVKLEELQDQLARRSQIVRLAAAFVLHELCVTYTSELANYSISADFITAYKKCIDDIEIQNAKKDLILDENKKNKKKLSEMIRTIDTFLKDKLDWSIESYRELNSKMVNAYFTARKLKIVIYQHIAIRGFVVNKQNREPIANGNVSVLGTDLETKITEKGNFTFKNFPEGEFTLKIENINYETTTLTIRRYSNQYLNIKVEMQPLPISQQVE